MVNFPTSLDTGSTLPTPNTTDKRNSPSHAGLHGSENAAIIATETKIGTGASTPVANTLLFGTGTGTSAWTALTSAQLLATISDETGTGSLVFATTPTLVTPKVDTINEATGGNGTTIGGVNIKSGALNTNNSVVAANITNANVTASKLATGAASAAVATSETTASATYVQLATTTDAVTVTIGANGLALICLSSYITNSGTADMYVGVDISGATTVAATDVDALELFVPITVLGRSSYVFLKTGLAAGSTTFKMKYRTSAGTATFKNRQISVVPL